MCHLAYDNYKVAKYLLAYEELFLKDISVILYNYFRYFAINIILIPCVSPKIKPNEEKSSSSGIANIIARKSEVAHTII